MWGHGLTWLLLMSVVATAVLSAHAGPRRKRDTVDDIKDTLLKPVTEEPSAWEKFKGGVERTFDSAKRGISDAIPDSVKKFGSDAGDSISDFAQKTKEGAEGLYEKAKDKLG